MRKDLNNEQCLEMLRNNYVGRLGYIFEKRPFVVPITYFYSEENNSVIGYSGKGQKLKALRKNKFISLEIDEIESIDHWRSVLVHGEFEELHQTEAKYLLHAFALGVEKLIAKKEKRELHAISEFSTRIIKEEIPIVFRIKDLEWTGKYRDQE
ncbi:flavin mononucleotide-binding protein [Christiangramia fulva]|uniref:Flavin mononucleotide-binding protein n=1 Tax=Christiangramia fulva TaxID=2126553 RepID=A0A2R3Z5M2_9FLAO|nr:pyridoxamine 5'-phosphate oxidase family protein [Christiangramia fulva]AVR45571.1 flavin mononucleotide-binding protein [Christiangramia fulva]